MENYTYMTKAKEYEEAYIKVMNEHKGSEIAHVPKFEEDLYENYENQEKSKMLADSIEAMVMQSEKRFGEDYYLMITPIQNYLYDKYHVDPIDLEFLGFVYLRAIFRAGEAGVKSATNQLMTKLKDFTSDLDVDTLEKLMKVFEEEDKENAEE